MKKLRSLLKACMTSDMNIFRIKNKKKGKASLVLPVVLSLYLMFTIFGLSTMLFMQLSENHTQYVLLSILSFGICLFTFIEGIYKSGPLIFNCKDDDLLLSLPIKKSTVVFIRIFKFYVFEFIFNSIFLFPVILAYLRWNEGSTISFIILGIIMLTMLPIIPIALSCIIGVIVSSIANRFKSKNAIQIVLSMILLVGVFIISMNSNKFLNYLLDNASIINDKIIKYYYPAGIFGKLANEFNTISLLIFVGINIIIFLLTILMISKVYFRINTRAKSVIKNSKSRNVVIKSRSKTSSLIKKELSTFFNTPVFIVNSGFGLVLFIVFTALAIIKFDAFASIITKSNYGMGLTKESLLNNTSILIFVLITITSFLTSITNSVISLEGRKINISKSLPVKVKTILMSKVYACLIITTPVLLLGDIALFIKFKTNILEAILLLILSILMPLISHFLGILINLKYPKLDAENNAEVVKQSTSSFVAVMIGMVLMILNVGLGIGFLGKINSIIVLSIFVVIFIIFNLLLYLILNTWGTKKFNSLNI